MYVCMCIYIYIYVHAYNDDNNTNDSGGATRLPASAAPDSAEQVVYV